MAMLKGVFAFPPRPSIGEVFSLAINGDEPWNNPMTMLFADGYDSGKWKFVGESLHGVYTC
jgi:hypothetical protein